jgi:hypothetical protein
MLSGEAQERSMVRAMTVKELEAARDLYAKQIFRLEEMGANPEFGITDEHVSRLVEQLELLHDQYDAMISYYREGDGTGDRRAQG